LKILEIYAVDIVREYQRGFKKGRSTTDDIYTLKQLMENYYEYNKDLHQCRNLVHIGGCATKYIGPMYRGATIFDGGVRRLSPITIQTLSKNVPY